MPWKESNLMDERLGFVAKLLDGESLSSVCREFGISRKTGYKIFNRYKLSGLEGLQNQSRRPSRQDFRISPLHLLPENLAGLFRVGWEMSRLPPKLAVPWLPRDFRKVPL
jgi:transposase